MTFRAKVASDLRIVGLLTDVVRAEHIESACAGWRKARAGCPTPADIVKMDWEHTMRDSPEFATMVGFPGQNDRWSDLSMEAIQRRKEELKGPIRVIKSIDRAKLNRLIS